MLPTALKHLSQVEAFTSEIEEPYSSPFISDILGAEIAEIDQENKLLFRVIQVVKEYGATDALADFLFQDESFCELVGEENINRALVVNTQEELEVCMESSLRSAIMTFLEKLILFFKKLWATIVNLTKAARLKCQLEITLLKAAEARLRSLTSDLKVRSIKSEILSNVPDGDKKTAYVGKGFTGGSPVISTIELKDYIVSRPKPLMLRILCYCAKDNAQSFARTITNPYGDLIQNFSLKPLYNTMSALSRVRADGMGTMVEVKQYLLFNHSYLVQNAIPYETDSRLLKQILDHFYTRHWNSFIWWAEHRDSGYYSEGSGPLPSPHNRTTVYQEQLRIVEDPEFPFTKLGLSRENLELAYDLEEWNKGNADDILKEPYIVVDRPLESFASSVKQYIEILSDIVKMYTRASEIKLDEDLRVRSAIHEANRIKSENVEDSQIVHDLILEISKLESLSFKFNYPRFMDSLATLSAHIVKQSGILRNLISLCASGTKKYMAQA